MCVRHDLKGCVTNFANVPMIENDGNRRKKKITLEKSHNHGVRVTIFLWFRICSRRIDV